MLNFQMAHLYVNCRIASGRNCCNMGELILLFYGVMLDWYREGLVALGGNSFSSSRKPGSDIAFNFISERSAVNTGLQRVS